MKTNLLFTLLFSFSNILFAQRAGDLDATLNGGKVTVDKEPLEVIVSLVALPDGKILAAGVIGDENEKNASDADLILARFNANGGLDAGFGAGGIVNTGFPFGELANHPFALQDDGKIVIAAIEHDNTYDYNSDTDLKPVDKIHLVRYNANGTVDNTFNQTVISDTSFIATVSILIQSDGSIVVAGTLRSYSSLNFESCIYMVQCDREGKIENRNKVFLERHTQAMSVVLQPDDKMLMMCKPYDNHAFGLLRLNADCSADNTFGNNGVVMDTSTNVDGHTLIATAIGVQSDGKILLAGTFGFSYWNDDAECQFGLMRYNNDGSLDASFGDNGKQATTLYKLSMVQALLVQRDDKIVLGGLTGASDDMVEFALVRYNADGSVDHNFGRSGIVTTRFNNTAVIFGLTQQQDGKIIAAGGTGEGSVYKKSENVDIALARYHSEAGTKLSESTVAGNISITGPVRSEELFQYTLAQDANVTIELFDVSGRLVMTLASNEPRSAGSHNETLRFDESLPSGRYLLTLSSAQGSESTWVVKQ